ncbi:MAG TPA: TonB-dependent receptor [Opitutaceae bacterium]|nr:TonB-dependent receptor [Opitutaceae bacterium]
MSTFRSRKLATHLLSAAALSVLVAPTVRAQVDAATTQPANPSRTGAATTDDVQKLEAFTVTGSRIKRVDAETVSPVTVIRSNDLAMQGFPSVADAIRSLPFNSGQALTPTDSGNSFTPGVSAFNLRGLGNNNTLVLINGRRAVPYAAPGFNGLQTVFDLNSIPEAAIESVSILKDGGSALYGSDAVAGVIDFKLRHDYNGVFTSFQVGDYFDTGGLQKKVQFVAGAGNSKTTIFVAGSWSQQDSVYSRDLAFSKNADKSPVLDKADAYYYTPDNAADLQKYLDVGLTNPKDDGIFDLRSSRGNPGRVVVDGTTYTYDSPTTTPTQAAAVEGTNLYNFQQDQNLFPSIRQYSFYTSLRHNITDNLYLFSELSYTRVDTISDAAPTPVDLASEHGLTTDSVMTIPSYNIYNPFGVDISSGSVRLNEVGNRINDVSAETPRILAGIGGTIPDSEWMQGWTWEAAGLYMRNSVANANHGSVTDYGMQEALNGLTRKGDGSLTWDSNTPLSDRVYFNWFGPNDPMMAKFLRIDNPTSASLEYQQFDASATGTFLDLPGGRAGLAIGAEHRMEKLEVIQTDLNQVGNIVGGAQGTSAYGDRRVSSVYAEAALPVFKWLEFQVAGRYEKYSDEGFNAKVRPKYGVKIKPLPWLVLRASYTESFKAPDLAYLYTGATTTFTDQNYIDPVTGDSEQIEIRSAGNPDLQPEITKTFYTGFVVEPQKGFLSGFSASLDFFRYQQSGLLGQLSDFYGYSEFLTRAAKGDPLFAPRVIRDPASNRITYINDDYSNISSAENRGYDAELSYRLNTSNLGTFRFALSGTYLDKYAIDGDDVAGHELNAHWNANFLTSWEYHDWEATTFISYRGARHGDAFIFGLGGDVSDLYVHYTIKPQYTVNMSVARRLPWDSKVVVGVDNIFDSKPPLDPLQTQGSTPGVNLLEPAFWYVRLEKHF